MGETMTFDVDVYRQQLMAVREIQEHDLMKATFKKRVAIETKEVEVI